MFLIIELVMHAETKIEENNFYFFKHLSIINSFKNYRLHAVFLIQWTAQWSRDPSKNFA